MQSNQGIKILIAEDDSPTRIILATTLSQWGFEVREAGNGEEAWEIIQQPDSPQLLIFDWLMPKLDGLSLCQRIKRELPYWHCYIILLTQLTGTENIIRGLDAGADEFLTKPFNAAELRSRLSVGRRIIEYQNILSEKNKQLQDQLTEISHAFVELSNDMNTLQQEWKNNLLPYSENELITLQLTPILEKNFQKIENIKNNLKKKLSNIQFVTPTEGMPERIVTNKIIDIDRLKTVFGDNTVAVQRFINEFISSTKDLLIKIKNAMETRNSDLLRELFHQLKGSCDEVGASTIHELSEKARQYILQQNWEELETLYQALNKALQELYLEIKNKYP